MADLEPIETKNLDIYGNAPLTWGRARNLLTASQTASDDAYDTYFLGTVRPDGRPHTTGVGALWYDGDLYFTSGPQARKARNLAANSACTIAVKLTGLDLAFEGEATRIVDRLTLEALASRYREGGWPAQVQDDAFTAPFSAPSAGPPPWYLYRFTFHTVFGVATAEPNGATRWRFDR